jgi:chromosome segregation ATPase
VIDIQAHIHTTDEREILRLLRELLAGQDVIKARLAKLDTRLEALMALSAEAKALLDSIDQTTSDLASTLNTQGAKLTEISADIDDLIAHIGTVDETELKTRLQAHSDALAGAATVASETSAALTGLAAKHDPTP